MGPSRRLSICVAGALLVACGGSNPIATIPPGVWGSIAVEMDVGPNGAALSFCCATGQIPPPLTVDASGHFDYTGSYTTHRGPIIVGRNPTYPARYSGSLNGTSLTLVVTTPANPAPETDTLVFGTHSTALCVCPLFAAQAGEGRAEGARLPLSPDHPPGRP